MGLFTLLKELEQDMPVSLDTAQALGFAFSSHSDGNY